MYQVEERSTQCAFYLFFYDGKRRRSGAEYCFMESRRLLRLQIFRVVIVEVPVVAGLALDEDEGNREQNSHKCGK